MATDINTSTSITIDASPDRVWEAMTTPELIEKWFFGVKTESDWVKGSPIVHRGEYDGESYEDKGTILQIVPEDTLVHTHWSPVSRLPDLPQNYQMVKWTLRDTGHATELTVDETNLPSTDAKAASEEGWSNALSGLKALVEV